MPHADEAESPPEFDELATRARTAAQQHDWGVSLALWSEARRLYPEQPESLAGVGEALLNLSRFDEADDILTSAIMRCSKDMTPAELYARVADERRDWPEAIARWKALRAKFQDRVEPFRGYADALRDAGFYVEADIVYRHAIRRFPQDQALRSGYALTAKHQLLWDEALARWRIVRRLFPLDPGGHLGVVESLIALGRIDEAQAALSEASALAPDNPEFWNRPAAPGQPPAATTNIETVGSHEPELTGVLLSRDPIIIHSAGASFESIVSSTMELYHASGRRAHYLLSLTSGLTTHTAERDRLAWEAAALRERFPDVSMTLLVNDVLELTAAWPLGIDVELVNGSCFVDEYTYTIDPTSLKRFDAICDLRAGSPERHRLAESVASIVLLAPTHTDEAKVADIVNTAHCALCLSRIGEPQEATVEYLLCGVPIVTSRGVGARDWWLSDDIAIFADDTEEDIAAAVARMRARALPGVHVRQTALHRIKRERAIFFELVDKVFAAHGQPARRFEPEFLKRFTHRWHEQQRRLSAFATTE